MWVVKGSFVLTLSGHRLESSTVENLTALARIAVPRMP